MNGSRGKQSSDLPITQNKELTVTEAEKERIVQICFTELEELEASNFVVLSNPNRL